MAEFYAVKDNKSGLFYNSQHKLSELGASTVFFKYKKRAEFEVGSLSNSSGIMNRIFKTNFKKEKGIKWWHSDYYSELHEYVKKHINDIDLIVVEIKAEEATNGQANT